MKSVLKGRGVSVWVARATIAAALLGIVALLVAQRFGALGLVNVSHVEQTTVYTRGVGWLWMCLPLCTLMVAFAVVLWLNPVRWFRAASVAFIMFAAYVVYLAIDINRDHRVIVTDNHFIRRVGFSFSPEQQTVQYDMLAYMVVTRQRPTRGGRPRYDLECHTPSGAVMRVPIHGLMKLALPEILARAEAHDVLIGDGETGERIPADL
ncbi:MAG: hypothetical protein R3C10_24455 [Pirellulales bacterium]